MVPGKKGHNQIKYLLFMMGNPTPDDDLEFVLDIIEQHLRLTLDDVPDVVIGGWGVVGS